MFNRPMSNYRLGDTIQYQKYIGDDGFGPDYEDPITIENVRFQRLTEKVDEQDGMNVYLKGKVFIDRVNSTNSEVSEYVESGLVFHEGKEYTIHEVYEYKPQKDMEVRHWELVLR